MYRLVSSRRQCRLFFLLVMFQPALVPAQSSFPTPPEAPQRLFFVQRNPNTNTIVYDANTQENGRSFNSKQPILVYWLRYDEQGQVAPLSYLQRTMAYGVEVRAGKRAGEFEFNVVAYPKRKLRLLMDANLRPRAELVINGKPAWLNRVFIKIEGKKAGLIPDVKYVELFGTDPATGKAVYERFVP
ncbi:MAG: DUF4833 domain-containing protein [Saprospiraceae bacterium]|nr:DUF4833 domain-containing protein [Saprospiraceae bacterium]